MASSYSGSRVSHPGPADLLSALAATEGGDVGAVARPQRERLGQLGLAADVNRNLRDRAGLGSRERGIRVDVVSDDRGVAVARAAPEGFRRVVRARRAHEEVCTYTMSIRRQRTVHPHAYLEVRRTARRIHDDNGRTS